jgi:lipoate-protein ligase B
MHIPRTDYIGYVRKLEQALIIAITALGVSCQTIQDRTGVWVSQHVAAQSPNCPEELLQRPSKIAAIGVRIDVRGVTRHGFALNINPAMEYWQGIVPCGLSDAPVACLAQLINPLPDMQTVIDRVVQAIGQTFNFRMNMV